MAYVNILCSHCLTKQVRFFDRNAESMKCSACTKDITTQSIIDQFIAETERQQQNNKAQLEAAEYYKEFEKKRKLQKRIR